MKKLTILILLALIVNISTPIFSFASYKDYQYLDEYDWTLKWSMVNTYTVPWGSYSPFDNILILPKKDYFKKNDFSKKIYMKDWILWFNLEWIKIATKVPYFLNVSIKDEKWRIYWTPFLITPSESKIKWRHAWLGEDKDTVTKKTIWKWVSSIADKLWYSIGTMWWYWVDAAYRFLTKNNIINKKDRKSFEEWNYFMQKYNFLDDWYHLDEWTWLWWWYSSKLWNWKYFVWINKSWKYYIEVSPYEWVAWILNLILISWYDIEQIIPNKIGVSDLLNISSDNSYYDDVMKKTYATLNKKCNNYYNHYYNDDISYINLANGDLLQLRQEKKFKQSIKKMLNTFSVLRKWWWKQDLFEKFKSDTAKYKWQYWNWFTKHLSYCVFNEISVKWFPKRNIENVLDILKTIKDTEDAINKLKKIEKEYPKISKSLKIASALRNIINWKSSYSVIIDIINEYAVEFFEDKTFVWKSWVLAAVWVVDSLFDIYDEFFNPIWKIFEKWELAYKKKEFYINTDKDKFLKKEEEFQKNIYLKEKNRTIKLISVENKNKSSFKQWDIVDLKFQFSPLKIIPKNNEVKIWIDQFKPIWKQKISNIWNNIFISQKYKILDNANPWIKSFAIKDWISWKKINKISFIGDNDWRYITNFKVNGKIKEVKIAKKEPLLKKPNPSKKTKINNDELRKKLLNARKLHNKKNKPSKKIENKEVKIVKIVKSVKTDDKKLKEKLKKKLEEELKKKLEEERIKKIEEKKLLEEKEKAEQEKKIKEKLEKVAKDKEIKNKNKNVKSNSNWLISWKTYWLYDWYITDFVISGNNILYNLLLEDWKRYIVVNSKKFWPYNSDNLGNLITSDNNWWFYFEKEWNWYANINWKEYWPYNLVYNIIIKNNNWWFYFDKEKEREHYANINWKEYWPIYTLQISDNHWWFSYEWRDWELYENINWKSYWPYKYERNMFSVWDNNWWFHYWKEDSNGDWKNYININWKEYWPYEDFWNISISNNNWWFIYHDKDWKNYANINWKEYWPYNLLNNIFIKNNNWWVHFEKEWKYYININWKEYWFINRINQLLVWNNNWWVRFEKGWKYYTNINWKEYWPYENVWNISISNNNWWFIYYDKDWKYYIKINWKEYWPYEHIRAMSLSNNNWWFIYYDKDWKYYIKINPIKK